MVSDDVDVVDIQQPTDDSHIEAQIQQCLDDNSGATSLDHVEKVYESQGRAKLAFIHTD